MPTTSQVKTIKLGARVCGLGDAQYRLLLRNVAGVDSSTKLDNHGVEDVLAVLEDLGFDSHPAGPTYWRDKVRARGSVCGERMARKIRALADGGRYDLTAMCRRHSNGEADVPEQLTPAQGWALVEALKAINDREAKHERRAAAPRTGLLFGGTEEPARTPDRGTDAPLNQPHVDALCDDDVPF
jgi:hypothetical protein